MLGIYNYTVILTYLGMLSGFAGILFLLNGNVRGALICLMVSGVCDMFDGKVASTKKDRTRSEKRFGIQIDSLSDLICFGVLPALIVYSVGRRTWLRAAACGAYALCALIRLAWFNVDEEARQDFDTGRRKVYLGLPVTSAAAVFPLLSAGGGGLFDPLLHTKALSVRAKEAQAPRVPAVEAAEEKRCKRLRTTAPSAFYMGPPWAGAC